MAFLSPTQAQEQRPPFQDEEVPKLGTLRILRLPLIERMDLGTLWNEGERDDKDELTNRGVFDTFARIICRCLDSPDPEEPWDSPAGIAVIRTLNLDELTRLKNVAMGLNGMSEFEEELDDENAAAKNG